MEELQETNWIDEMIQREAIPKAARQGTTGDFCKKWGITESTYYYQSSKEENQKKSLKIALMLAKKKAPEVLEKLADQAGLGKEKSIEMFLDYVLELSKNLDIKSGGEPLQIKIIRDGNQDDKIIPATG